MDPIRRKILKTGAAATAMASAPRVFAQQTGPGGAAMSFYEKGPVRILYEEAGSGFPLLLIAVAGGVGLRRWYSVNADTRLMFPIVLTGSSVSSEAAET
jgi:hypothetical protein